IHEEVDAVLAPLQGIDMKVQPGCRHMDARSLLCVQDMVIGRGVDSPVDAAGLVTEMFHDVDLAALWPSYLIDIRAEQPDRRPGTAGAREFRAHFEAPIEEIHPPSRVDARRGVGVSAPALPSRFDDQGAVLDPDILRVRGIELRLIVAHIADLIIPFRGIRTAGSLELIVKDQSPTELRRLLGTRGVLWGR